MLTMNGEREPWIERRTATAIGSTDGIPQGTLVSVPVAPPSGGTGLAPVVAVSTTHWYKDPGFMSAAGGALLALASPVVEVLTEFDQPFHWRPFLAGCILALTAYFRNRSNSVIR